MNLFWCAVHESITTDREDWSGKCHLGSSESDNWQSWDDPPDCRLLEARLEIQADKTA